MFRTLSNIINYRIKPYLAFCFMFAMYSLKQITRKRQRLFDLDMLAPKEEGTSPQT